MSGYKKDTNFGKHKVSEFANSESLNDVSSNKLSRTMSDTLRTNSTESNLLLNMLRPDVLENRKQPDGLSDFKPNPITNSPEKPLGLPKQPFFNSFNPFDFLEATSPLLQRQSSSSTPETTEKRDIASPVKVRKQQDASPLTFRKDDTFKKEQKSKSKTSFALHPFPSPTKKERSDMEESHFSQFIDDKNLPHEVYSIDPPMGRSFTLPPSCISSPLLVESFHTLAKQNLPYNCFYEPLALADKKNQYAAYVDQNLNGVCVLNVDTKQYCALDCESQVVYLGFGEDTSSNIYLLVTDCEGKASVWKINDGDNSLSASLALSVFHPLLRGCTWVSGDSNFVGVLVKNKYHVIQVPLNKKSMKIGSAELLDNSVITVEAPSTINSCSLSMDKTVLALLVDFKVYLYQVALSAGANTEKLISTPFAFIELRSPSPANSIFFLSTKRKDGTFLDRILCISYNQSSTLLLFDFGCRQVTQEIKLKNENRKFSPHILGVSNNQDLISSISADYLEIFSYHASSLSSDMDRISTSSFIMSALNSEVFGESGYVGAVMSKTILNDGILYSNMISENNDELNLLLVLTSGYYLLSMDADCFSREGKSLDYPTPEQPILASACLEKVDKGLNSAPALREFKLPVSIKETENTIFEYASSILNSSSSEHLKSIVGTIIPQDDEVFSFVNMLLKKRVNEKLKEELPNQIESLIRLSIGSHLNATLKIKIKQTAEECFKKSLNSYEPTAFIYEGKDLLKNSLEKIKLHNQEKATAMSDLAKRVSTIRTSLENKNTHDDGSYSIISNDVSHHLDDLSGMIDATKNEEALIFFTKYPNVHMFRMLKRIPDYALDECSFIHLLTFIHTLSTFIFADDDLKKLCIQLMSRATSRLRAMEAPRLVEKDNVSPELFPTVVEITLKNVETLLFHQVVPGYETKYEFLKTSLKSLRKELRTSYGL
ncbi:WD repeat protein associated with stress granule [Schizosaccharomyces osmophilus]|uniref:WD repeat protein associated with stress granule n=1 Tax=Schizosaccharomyces osmophilus TaxID=2545709 RepID=A0AAE9WDW5_9SCHI|nr:WD repeat protein associated with stress granule [Schizosaccharomyces osmophilus]WBW74459.1 WD repeat protein associated with stress granule [Schizosaccharomyces osmophilus]